MYKILSYRLFESEDRNYHLNIIKDLFQEVIDELSLEKYDCTGYPSNGGLYYDIVSHIKGNGIGEKVIRLVIAIVTYDEESGNRKITFSNKKEIRDGIYNSDTLKNFIERVSSLGYKSKFMEDYLASGYLVYDIDYTEA